MHVPRGGPWTFTVTNSESFPPQKLGENLQDHPFHLSRKTLCIKPSYGLSEVCLPQGAPIAVRAPLAEQGQLPQLGSGLAPDGASQVGRAPRAGTRSLWASVELGAPDPCLEPLPGKIVTRLLALQPDLPSGLQAAVVRTSKDPRPFYPCRN